MNNNIISDPTLSLNKHLVVLKRTLARGMLTAHEFADPKKSLIEVRETTPTQPN